MSQTPEPAAEHHGAQQPAAHIRDVEVRVRRAPKYGVFMAIGAIIGALAAWLIAWFQPPAVNEAGQRIDTMPVVGLSIVAGFVLGVLVGGIAAIIVDRVLSKRISTLPAEQVDVDETDLDGADLDATGAPAPEDAGEATFTHHEPRADETQERDRPAGA